MITLILSALGGVVVGVVVMQLLSYKRRNEHIYQSTILKTKLEAANQRIVDLQQDHELDLQRLKTSQQELMAQQMAFVKEQMTSTSEKILHDRQSQLLESNSRQMSEIVTPLQNELKRMQEIVAKADREHTSSMERLDATIRETQKNADSIGQKADRLAQVLIGEGKTQGSFGELRLKQLLDDMGFEEGLQYEQQVTLSDDNGRTIKNAQGQRMQPDVILHFPENRDILIDSKVSLKAFEEYHETSDETLKKEALKRHVNSMRTHINELSSKDYFKYLKGNRLDFVIMYVFSEGALQLALSAEPSLYKDAYDKRVIICGSNNLYALLRVLESAWKQMYQVQNQQEIVAVANVIVERVQKFYERFLKVEECLASTQRAIESVKTVTADQGQSIVTAANKLVKLGASEAVKHKALPKA